MTTEPDRVLYRDADLVALDKPAGADTYRHLPDDPESAVELAERLCGLPGGSLRAVHRLDRFTSGVLLLATSKGACRHYARLFEHRQVRKDYFALVEGAVAFARGELDVPLLVTTRRTVPDPERGQPASTSWRLEEDFGGHALLRVQVGTGRKHQIRAHLAHAGHPLLGDVQYGGSPRLELPELEPMVLAGPLLHAAELVLPRPEPEGALRVEAPLPRAFVEALELLRRHKDRMRSRTT